MNGKTEFISFLIQQDVKTKLDAIDALMESLSPADHEMLIHAELEWLSPIGLDNAKAKIAELEMDEKKDTTEVPKKFAQDNDITPGDKVRLLAVDRLDLEDGYTVGHSFLVNEVGEFGVWDGLHDRYFTFAQVQKYD